MSLFTTNALRLIRAQKRHTLAGTPKAARKELRRILDDVRTLSLTAEQLTEAAQVVEPNPSPRQKAAGNFSKAHISWQNLPITIEVAKGGYRRGVDKNGKAWECCCERAHYGYFKSTSGNDSENLDCFLCDGTGDGEDINSHVVFVIDQVKPDGSWDEHKTILGCTNAKTARAVYLAAYKPGWKGIGCITPMTLPDFKAWIAAGDTSRPVGDIGQTLTLSTAPVQQQQPASPPAGEHYNILLLAYLDALIDASAGDKHADQVAEIIWHKAHPEASKKQHHPRGPQTTLSTEVEYSALLGPMPLDEEEDDPAQQAAPATVPPPAPLPPQVQPPPQQQQQQAPAPVVPAPAPVTTTKPQAATVPPSSPSAVKPAPIKIPSAPKEPPAPKVEKLTQAETPKPKQTPAQKEFVDSVMKNAPKPKAVSATPEQTHPTHPEFYNRMGQAAQQASDDWHNNNGVAPGKVPEHMQQDLIDHVHGATGKWIRSAAGLPVAQQQPKTAPEEQAAQRYQQLNAGDTSPNSPHTIHAPNGAIYDHQVGNGTKADIAPQPNEPPVAVEQDASGATEPVTPNEPPKNKAFYDPHVPTNLPPDQLDLSPPSPTEMANLQKMKTDWLPNDNKGSQPWAAFSNLLLYARGMGPEPSREQFKEVMAEAHSMSPARLVQAYNQLGANMIFKEGGDTTKVEAMQMMASGLANSIKMHLKGGKERYDLRNQAAAGRYPINDRDYWQQVGKTDDGKQIWELGDTGRVEVGGVMDLPTEESSQVIIGKHTNGDTFVQDTKTGRVRRVPKEQAKPPEAQVAEVKPPETKEPDRSSLFTAYQQNQPTAATGDDRNALKIAEHLKAHNVQLDRDEFDKLAASVQGTGRLKGPERLAALNKVMAQHVAEMKEARRAAKTEEPQEQSAQETVAQTPEAPQQAPVQSRPNTDLDEFMAREPEPEKKPTQGMRHNPDLDAAFQSKAEPAQEAQQPVEPGTAESQAAQEPEPPARAKRKSTKKPSGSLFSVVLKKGGTNPRILSGSVNVKKDVIENGLLGLLNKNGYGLDTIAKEMEAEGHIKVPANRNSDDYLLELLRDKQKSDLSDQTKQHDTALDAHYKDLEDARAARIPEPAIAKSAGIGEAIASREAEEDELGDAWEAPGSGPEAAGDFDVGEFGDAGDSADNGGVAEEQPVAPEEPPKVTFKPNASDTNNPGDYRTINVDASKLDSAWAKDKDNYIPKGGGGAEIGGRRANFEKFLEKGEPIEASRATIDPRTGRVTFADGRHRFSVLRDKGVKTVALTVPSEQADEFEKRMGDGQGAASEPQNSTDRKSHPIEEVTPVSHQFKTEIQKAWEQIPPHLRDFLAEKGLKVRVGKRTGEMTKKESAGKYIGWKNVAGAFLAKERNKGEADDHLNVGELVGDDKPVPDPSGLLRHEAGHAVSHYLHLTRDPEIEKAHKADIEAIKKHPDELSAYRHKKFIDNDEQTNGLEEAVAESFAQLTGGHEPLFAGHPFPDFFPRTIQAVKDRLATFEQQRSEVQKKRAENLASGEKSRGHSHFDSSHEYFRGPEGEWYSSPLENPLDERGFRTPVKEIRDQERKKALEEGANRGTVPEEPPAAEPIAEQPAESTAQLQARVEAAFSDPNVHPQQFAELASQILGPVKARTKDALKAKLDKHFKEQAASAAPAAEPVPQEPVPQAEATPEPVAEPPAPVAEPSQEAPAEAPLEPPPDAKPKRQPRAAKPMGENAVTEADLAKPMGENAVTEADLAAMKRMTPENYSAISAKIDAAHKGLSAPQFADFASQLIGTSIKGSRAAVRQQLDGFVERLADSYSRTHDAGAVAEKPTGAAETKSAAPDLNSVFGRLASKGLLQPVKVDKAGNVKVSRLEGGRYQLQRGKEIIKGTREEIERALGEQAPGEQAPGDAAQPKKSERRRMEAPDAASQIASAHKAIDDQIYIGTGHEGFAKTAAILRGDTLGPTLTESLNDTPKLKKLYGSIPNATPESVRAAVQGSRLAKTLSHEDSPKDAKEWGDYIDSHYVNWSENLPEQQRNAFSVYATGAYEDINSYLRTGKLTKDGAEQGNTVPETNKLIENMDSALADAPPTDRPLKLSRVLGTHSYDQLEAGQIKPGQVIEDPAYQSTSYGHDYGTAAPSLHGVTTISSNVGPLGKAVVLDINVPKGSRVAPIGAMSSIRNESEAEIVLPRDAKYVVRGVKKDGETYRVQVDYVPSDGSHADVALAKDAERKPTEPDTTGAADIPDTLDGLKTVKSLGGSTGAALVTDGTHQFVMKRGNSPEHLKNEDAADKAYEALGIGVPVSKILETASGPAKLSQYIPNAQTIGQYIEKNPDKKQEIFQQAQKGFVADALLGNWDAIGSGWDNMLIDPSGKLHRIDNGGALNYRAQGAKKTPDQFGPTVPEIQSMRDPKINRSGAAVYGGITDQEISQQVKDIASKREQLLAALPEDVRQTVGKRLDWLQQKFGNVPKATTTVAGPPKELPSGRGPDQLAGAPHQAKPIPEIDSQIESSPLHQAWLTGEHRKSVDDDQNQDYFHAHQLHELGYSALPQVVSADDLNKQVADGATLLYRGWEQPQHANAYRSGPLFGGRGIFGNGTYAAFDTPKAAESGGRKHPDNGALSLADDYAKGTGVVTRMALAKDAKVGEFEHVQKEQQAFLSNLNAKIKSLGLTWMSRSKRQEKAKLKRLRELYDGPNNLGRFASMAGYDAIRNSREAFVSLLNRGKVSIEDANHKT